MIIFLRLSCLLMSKCNMIHVRSYLLLVVACCLPLLVKARKVEDWPYARLYASADLVVIAHSLGSTDTADQLDDPAWGKNLIGVETRFEVAQVLKGGPLENLVLLHFRSDALLQNGPSLVAFRTRGRTLTILETEAEGKRLVEPMIQLVAEASPPVYLLFLTKKGLRYEAVSGQIDPGFSVRQLQEP